MINSLRLEIFSLEANTKGFKTQVNNCQTVEDSRKRLDYVKNKCIEFYFEIEQTISDDLEKSDLKARVDRTLKRCNSAEKTIEHFERVEPRIQKMFDKCQGIKQKLESGQCIFKDKKKIGEYVYYLQQWQMNQNPATQKLLPLETCATLKIQVERAVITQEILNKFTCPLEEQINDLLKNSIDNRNEEDKNKLDDMSTIFSLNQLLANLPTSLKNENRPELIQKLTKYVWDFTEDKEQPKNILERTYFHLYHILNNEEIPVTGLEKTDLCFGEKAFASENVSEDLKIRALNRTYAEFLLELINLGINNDSPVCGFFGCKLLEKIVFDPKDCCDGKNIAHMLYEEQYNYSGSEDKYDSHSPIWKGEFGRIAFAASGFNSVVSADDKFQVLQTVQNAIHEKWKIEA